MKSAQSMTVSRHVQSVRSVHRRGTYRKSGFVIGRYGNMIPRAVHCTRIPLRFPYPSGRFLLTRTTALQPSRERERERENLHPQRRISLCISSRRAACKTRVPHETLYSTAFVRPISEKRSRPFTYLPSSSMLLNICGLFLHTSFFDVFAKFLKNFVLKDVRSKFVVLLERVRKTNCYAIT